MSKRHSAKYKLDRRLGENLWGRPKSPVNKREYGPGQHGQRRKQKPTDFGVQLMAKQKLKGYYGNIGEKQFRKYYDEAVRRKGDTSENLIELLERRLDAVIYRMKFAITPFAARQFVNHGHVMVNGRRVNIPSFSVRDDDEIEVRVPGPGPAESGGDAGGSGNSSRGEGGKGGGESRSSRSVRRVWNRLRADAISLYRLCSFDE